MPPKIATHWMIRDDQGRLQGPVSTGRVHDMILTGELRGEEAICAHPAGRWMPISAASDFSDQILDALAREVQEASGQLDGRAEAKDESVATEVVPAKSVTGATSEIGAGSMAGNRDRAALSVVPAGSTRDPARSRAPGPAPKPPAPSAFETLLSKIGLTPKTLPLAILGLGALVLLAGILFAPSAPPARFHLLAPRLRQPPIEQDKAVAMFARGLNAFEKDAFSGYVRAQNEFVQVVEGQPQSLQGYSALCLTYRELWPYSAQDSRDLKAIDFVAAQAKRVDPTGLNGALCEITRLLIRGRYPEARGLVETWSQNPEAAASMMEIQGSNALAIGDDKSAQFFFESARRLRPRWIKPYLLEAQARMAMGDGAGALALLSSTLKANPTHQAARVELGIVEHRAFRHEDKAIELLNGGLSESEPLPRMLESDGYLALAEAYLARQQKSKALAAARKAYALNSALDDARKIVIDLGGARELPSASADQIFLVDQYMQSGDYVRAQAAAKAAFDQDHKNAVAAMKAAECLWKLNQASEAIEWMKKAIAADSKLATAYVELSQYYADQFDYLSATSVLRKIQSLAPRSHEVYRGFAYVELQQRNFKAASAAGERALELYDMDAESCEIVAKAKIGLGDYVKAQDFAGRAIELDPSSVDAKVINAKALAGLHGTGEGVRYARQLISDYRYVVDYRIALAEILAKDNRWQEALDAYNEARSMQNQKPDKRVLIGVGEALQQLGKGPSALTFYLQAAVLDPGDPRPVFLIGNLYFSQGKFADAIKQYERAIAINPRYPLAHVQIGRAQLRGGHPELAIVQADAERANYPNLCESYALAAEAQYASRNYAGCAQEYQKAVTLACGGSRTYVDLARCYRLSGSLDPAMSMLRQAESMESGFADLYKEYGALYQTLCKTEEAVKAYNTYLGLAPNATDGPEIMRQRDRAAQGNCQLTDAGG